MARPGSGYGRPLRSGPPASWRDEDAVIRARVRDSWKLLLGDVIDTCWKRLSRLRQSTFSFVPGRAIASVDEHEALLGMIEEGVDPRRLELAVRAHRLATPDAFLHRIHPAEPSTADSPTTAP